MPETPDLPDLEHVSDEHLSAFLHVVLFGRVLRVVGPAFVNGGRYALRLYDDRHRAARGLAESRRRWNMERQAEADYADHNGGEPEYPPRRTSRPVASADFCDDASGAPRVSRTSTISRFNLLTPSGAESIIEAMGEKGWIMGCHFDRIAWTGDALKRGPWDSSARSTAPMDRECHWAEARTMGRAVALAAVAALYPTASAEARALLS